jgi:trehalose 6-phosphate synthase/phosphatase
MTEDERRSRMRGLRARVKAFNVHEWVSSFLTELGGRSPDDATPYREPLGAAQLMVRFLDEARRHQDVVLLLDYDGTLVPTVARPELARPDEEVMSLLRALAAHPRTRVHLVTGRARGEVERWFGDLPIALHAEHGAWSRNSKGASWGVLAEMSRELREQALVILRQFAARTPGAFVEEKEISLAWHYRAAEVEFGALQATELRLHLAAAFSNAPVEILAGDKVVEVRPQGVNKGVVARRAVADAPKNACVLCLGNDRTDEDMFAALPEPAFTVRIGAGRSVARYRLPSPGAARELLRALLA